MLTELSVSDVHSPANQQSPLQNPGRKIVDKFSKTKSIMLLIIAKDKPHAKIE